MPIRFNIDHDKRQIEAQAEGEVNLEEVENFLDATVVQDSIRYRKLFDGRRSVPRFDDNEVMMLGARLSAYASSFGGRGALAFIAPSEGAAILARRVINLGKPSDWKARVFLSEDEARDWLAAQPET